MNMMQYCNTNNKEDLQRLVDLCNSYGLNEDQTSQILSQFKAGGISMAHLNIPEKNSFSQQDQSFNESQRKFDEQYSFKHNNFQNQHNANHHRRNKQEQQQQQQQFDHQQQNSLRQQAHEAHESIESNSRNFKKYIHIVKQLQHNNEKIQYDLKKKNQQIEMFINMKKQDSEIILGLKDIIAELTSQIKDKQLRYLEIQNKYNKVLEERNQTMLQQSKIVKFKEENSHHLIIPSKSKEQLRDNTNSFLNISQAKLKKQSSTPKLKQNQYPPIPQKQDHFKRQNRIDIGKYKGMIEQLRNSYHKVKG